MISLEWKVKRRETPARRLDAAGVFRKGAALLALEERQPRPLVDDDHLAGGHVRRPDFGFFLLKKWI